MKWLKLDCDFRYDPKIQELARQCRGGMAEAAGLWTLMLTFVATHGGRDCTVTMDDSTPVNHAYLADWLGIRCAGVEQKLRSFATLTLLQHNCSAQKCVIAIPNMLKRIDDYTRRVRTLSAQSPKKHGTDLDKEEDIEREDKTIMVKVGKQTPKYSPQFEKFWNASTRRGPKLEAMKVWAALNPDPKLFIEITCGMQDWIHSEQWQDETKQPHIFRWLKRHGWEEIIPKSGNILGPRMPALGPKYDGPKLTQEELKLEREKFNNFMGGRQ